MDSPLFVPKEARRALDEAQSHHHALGALANLLQRAWLAADAAGADELAERIAPLEESLENLRKGLAGLGGHHLKELCVRSGGHRPDPGVPDRCGTCGARLDQELAPSGNPDAVPTCSACVCSMRWDADYRQTDGADGAWVCVGCDELPSSCPCEPVPLEADVPHVSREEVGHG